MWKPTQHRTKRFVQIDATTGAVTTQKYWPYGGARAGGVPQTDKLYTGQREEAGDAAALGLYNYKARFYSTVLGRFVSVDPLVGSAGDPQSWNPYTYVRNNPMRLVDPSGTYFEEPGDSAPSAKKGFCGRDCRAMKALAARGIYTVEAAHAAHGLSLLNTPEKVRAALDAANYAGALLYLKKLNDSAQALNDGGVTSAGVYQPSDLVKDISPLTDLENLFEPDSSRLDRGLAAVSVLPWFLFQVPW